MLKICALCKKGPLAGKLVTRKGLYKKKGGTGSKIARASLRKFKPNIQKMRILLGGHPKKVYICTQCIKKGRFQKA